MASQNILLFAIGIGLGFLYIFWVSRNGYTNPSKLKLKGSGQFHYPSHVGFEEVPIRFYNSRSKNLNVMFMYNGHGWDAHQILGIPAGASMEHVRMGFERSLRETEPESHPFLHAAFSAIVMDFKNSSQFSKDVG